jgi:pimeloyl-ACP methyl ester carboxylesterase
MGSSVLALHESSVATSAYEGWTVGCKRGEDIDTIFLFLRSLMFRLIPPSRRLAQTLVVGFSLAWLSSCAVLLPTPEPIPTRHHGAFSAEASRGLLVFLPGFGDRAETFEAQGFVEAVGRLAPNWDVVSVDAHFGYYRDFSVIDRIREDVILPAKARGYKTIWLVGISMGGFGALAYSVRHASDIDGVLAMAPYLGPDSVFSEMRAAGGLDAWSPGDLESMASGREKMSRELWQWLKPYEGGGTPADRPVLVLAYGAGDRHARLSHLLRSLVPDDRHLVRPGGHTWTVWSPLFKDFLEGPFRVFAAR